LGDIHRRPADKPLYLARLPHPGSAFEPAHLALRSRIPSIKSSASSSARHSPATPASFLRHRKSPRGRRPAVACAPAGSFLKTGAVQD